MKLHHAIYANAVLFTVLNQVAPSFAAGDDFRGQRNGRRGPPQVAIDACGSLSAGDACSFTGRNGEQLSGTCFAPKDRELACKPEGHEHRHGHGEPGGERGSEQAPE